MKYLVKNKSWRLTEDYNINKLLYLLIDRPDMINMYNDYFWTNRKRVDHRNYNLPSVIYVSSGNIFWYYNGLHIKEISNDNKF